MTVITKGATSFVLNVEVTMEAVSPVTEVPVLAVNTEMLDPDPVEAEVVVEEDIVDLEEVTMAVMGEEVVEVAAVVDIDVKDSHHQEGGIQKCRLRISE